MAAKTREQPTRAGKSAPEPTRKEQYAAGKALRAGCPREAHARWKAPSDRRDAVELVLSEDR